MSLPSRVSRLQDRFGTQTERAYLDAIRAIETRAAELAQQLDENAASMTYEDRIANLTPLEHLAWSLRFTGEGRIEAIMCMHGWTEKLPPWLLSAMAFCTESDRRLL